MGKRLSGQDIDVKVGDFLVHIEEVTLSIEDSSKAVMSKGRPNGYVDGAISASGEITVDTSNFNVILDAAKKAGSVKQLKPLDIVFSGETVEDKLTVHAYECLLKLTDILDVNSNGEEKMKHKIPFEVTGKDFVKINGVPYAPVSDIEALR